MWRCSVRRNSYQRRGFVACSAAFLADRPQPQLRPIVIAVHLMFDAGAHAGKGLGPAELSVFKAHQEKASRDYAISGIFFDLTFIPGAWLRTMRGYPEIPDKFLMPKCINLFVTDTLRYDIDRDRTGGCSIGPRPRAPKFAADPFYKTFLGLRDAGENTLEHEYAHHLTLDTNRNPTQARNFWADLRNDYWLWLQRRGVPISGFRACANSEFATLAPGS